MPVIACVFSFLTIVTLLDKLETPCGYVNPIRSFFEMSMTLCASYAMPTIWRDPLVSGTTELIDERGNKSVLNFKKGATVFEGDIRNTCERSDSKISSKTATAFVISFGVCVSPLAAGSSK